MMQLFIFRESDVKYTEADISLLIAWLPHGISAAILKRTKKAILLIKKIAQN